MTEKDFVGNSRKLRILFFLISPFLLYFQLIQKYFVSDDFKVLNRVCLEKTLLVKRFFRPLSDLTIYLNYRIGGFQPAIFNSFNLLVHGINCILIYECCISIHISDDNSRNKQFAFIGAMLFMTYPFHNEGIVWLLGRGASMSCAFALGGILAMLSRYKLSTRLLLACACYFLGLLAYESVILLPVIILILLPWKSRRETILWIICPLLTLALHLVARTLFSGSVTGSYGQDFFVANPVIYLLNIPKTAGRLLFPPTGSDQRLASLYKILLIIVVIAVAFLIRHIRKSRHAKTLKALFLSLCIACITPVLSGISTRTSESDRMLYFPSVFLCIIAALLLTFYISNYFKKLILCCLLLTYNIFFLEKNNFNWVIAGDTSRSLMHLLKNRPLTDRIYIMDIPEEYEGAFIFRQGLKEALRINSIDSSKLIFVNYLTRDETALPWLSTVGRLLPVPDKNDAFIYWNRRSFTELIRKPEK